MHSYPIKHFVVIDPRQEPDALVAQVRICAGGTGKPVFLPRLNWALTPSVYGVCGLIHDASGNTIAGGNTIPPLV